MKILNIVTFLITAFIFIGCNRYDAPSKVKFVIGHQALEGKVSQIVVYGFLNGERKFEQKFDGTTSSSTHEELEPGKWTFSAYYADPVLTQDFLCEEVEIFLTGPQKHVDLNFDYVKCARLGAKEVEISACENSDCSDSPIGSIQMALVTETGVMNLGCVDLASTSSAIKMTIPMGDQIADRVVSKVFLDNNCNEKLEEKTIKEIKQEKVNSTKTNKKTSETISEKEFSFDPTASKIIIRKKAVSDGNTCKQDKNCNTGFCHPQKNICVDAKCADGFKNGTETDVDCGGTCGACEESQSCLEHTDCKNKTCLNNICTKPTCDDGVMNGTEIDVDCGGNGCGNFICEIGKTCEKNNQCVQKYCGPQTNVCEAASCTDGIKNADESDIDCGGDTCEFCDDTKTCNSSEDCLNGNCLNGVCAAAACDDGIKNGNETDTDCGGSCVACAVGLSCNLNADCSTDSCIDYLCTTPNCNDGVMNSDELDIDCGGSSCAAGSCGLGQTCSTNNQCIENFCGGLSTCEAASCNNSAQDTDETDVDCGGPSCAACEDNKACLAASDCQSGKCISGLCEPPNCSDGIKNEREGDIDCGGFNCNMKLCEAGQTCNEGYDCVSGVCGTDGICVVGCNIVSQFPNSFNAQNKYTLVSGNSSVCPINYDTRIGAPRLRTKTTICKAVKDVNLSSFGYSQEQLNQITDFRSHLFFQTIEGGPDYYYYQFNAYKNGTSVYGASQNGRTGGGYYDRNHIYKTEAVNSPSGVDRIRVLFGGKSKESWSMYAGSYTNHLRLSILGMPCPSCTDGIQNQDETDVDCGGSCDPCP